MPRQLRPRKNPTRYTDPGSEDENESEEGDTFSADDTGENESDFTPKKKKRKAREEEEEGKEECDSSDDHDTSDEIDELDGIDETRQSVKLSRSKKGQRSSKSTTKSPSKQKKSSRSAPLVQHRHRGGSLFTRSGPVERLDESPKIFQSTLVTLTSGADSGSGIADRIGRALGYNVGPGPLWELVEDRGWFKEAASIGETEAQRRPRVYGDVCVREGWSVLTQENAAPYLPTDDITTEDGTVRPPPPIFCHFGPIKSQQRREMKMFDTFSMSEYFSESQTHILNAGASVWGMDWCPIHPDDRPGRSYKKYLAIAPFPTPSHSPEIGRKVARPSYACIQIWSLASSQTPRKKSGKKNTDASSDFGHMRCEMVLCIETGPAYELKWCPLPSHDLISHYKKPRKLGVLAGIFEDGSFSIFVVPDPDDVKPLHHNDPTPIYVRLPQPILRIDIEESSCCSFDWANSGLIAIGTTNGVIATYRIGPAMESAAKGRQPPVTDLLPLYYVTVHQSAIRSIAWVRAPHSNSSGQPRVDQDPTVIASVGYDGTECLTDLREGRGAVMNRTRDVINAIAYSPFTGGLITVDHENMVKSYSVSSSMLGRGHSLLDPLGPIWSVHPSDYHPQLAVAAADGSCSTMNMLRSAKRGGSVPFFVHKIFHMDYNQHTNEFRMLDHFLPQETIDRVSTARTAKENPTDKVSRPTSAWPLKVGVHRVVWNNGNGLACSSLLATATASGLCRVEFLSGRWLKDKIPYGGIEGIRMENDDVDENDENAMLVDEILSDSGMMDAEGDEEEED